jgi:hypothetical protein
MLTEHADNIIVITQSADEAPVIRITGSLYAMPLMLGIAEDYVTKLVVDSMNEGEHQGE